MKETPEVREDEFADGGDTGLVGFLVRLVPR